MGVVVHVYFILHSVNNCDANTVFVRFRESADPHGCRAKGLKGWFTLKFAGWSMSVLLAKLVDGYIQLTVDADRSKGLSQTFSHRITID